MPTIRERNGGMDFMFMDSNHYEHDEDYESGSASPVDQDDDCSTSDIDSDECDRRKNEFVDDMTELNEQFCKIKDQLFSERETQINIRIEEIEEETDPEYQSRLTVLEENTKQRRMVADILIEYRKESIGTLFKAEELAIRQHLQNSQDLLYDQLKQDLEDKIKRLEEDRNSVDFTPGFFECRNNKAKARFHPFTSERKKKAAVVSGPYIVYNLKDEDILGDWTLVKKTTKQQAKKKKSES